MAKKGLTNNPNGRPKGTLNKRTLEWEEFGREFIADTLPKSKEVVQNWLDSGDDELQYKALNIVTGLLEYFKPKQARVAHIGEEGAPPITILANHPI